MNKMPKQSNGFNSFEDKKKDDKKKPILDKDIDSKYKYLIVSKP